MSDRIRVLVVDDSAYNRRTIIKMLEAIPGVEVIAYACDGEEALRKVMDLNPDLITLDLEMPRMDGFTFLRIVMTSKPTPVIVVSARSEDQNVFKALEFGAVEFIAKPSARISPELFNIREDLVRKVREIARTDMKKVLKRSSARTESAAMARAPAAKARISPAGGITQVVIAASTGGPPALQAILSVFRQKIPVGVAIAQHMPPGFTKAFAERLNKFCALEVSEARSGDIMRPGRVLISPGGKNLELRQVGADIVASVVDPKPGQRYIPSADNLFSSAAAVLGPRLLGVVLTGMGNDGAQGVRRIRDNGGQTLAEAEETSVVFGMPKEAIATGSIDKVLPLPRIGNEIIRRCGF